MQINVSKRRLLMGYAATFAFTSSQLRAHEQSNVERPIKLPDISLINLDGAQQTFDAYKGKVLLLNFWATWCPPCRAEMPSLEALHQSMVDKGLAIIGINQGESLEKVKSNMGIFMPQPTFPLLMDTSRGLGKYFKISDLPTSLVFNRSGILVGVANGARDFSSADIRNGLDSLLKQK